RAPLSRASSKVVWQHDLIANQRSSLAVPVGRENWSGWLKFPDLISSWRSSVSNGLDVRNLTSKQNRKSHLPIERMVRITLTKVALLVMPCERRAIRATVG